MWDTSCFGYTRDIYHIEDRAWRIIQRARESGVIYSPEELKREILELMKQFTDYEDIGVDSETSLPKKKVKVHLSRANFPIFLIIVEDSTHNLRMLKTFWTDRELIRNGIENWERRKKKQLSN